MLTRPVQLAEGGALAPGFEQPFEMLHACHERIEGMLALLARLREHVDAHGADEQARQAARDVLRYFDVAAPQHHLDEERHVLPALERSGAPHLVALAQRLREDHRRMESAWAAARSALEGLAGRQIRSLDPAAHARLDEFAALYPGHIAAEESTGFPVAQRGMQKPALQQMSQDMMRRRGVR